MADFSPDSARRVGRATRVVENARLKPTTSARSSRAYPPRILRQARLAVTTGTIGTATASTLGSGPATLQALKPDGTWITLGTPGNVTIWNMSTSLSIPSGSLVVVTVVDNMFVIDVVVC